MRGQQAHRWAQQEPLAKHFAQIRSTRSSTLVSRYKKHKHHGIRSSSNRTDTNKLTLSWIGFEPGRLSTYMGIGALKLTETKEQLSALSRVVSEVLYFTVTLPFSASSSKHPIETCGPSSFDQWIAWYRTFQGCRHHSVCRLPFSAGLVLRSHPAPGNVRARALALAPTA